MRMHGLIVAIVLAMVLADVPSACAQTSSAMRLADLVAQAERRNPQVAAAQQAVVAADARVLLVRAGRGPVITVSAAPGVSGGTSSQTAEGEGIAARNAVDQTKAALDVAVGLTPTSPIAVAAPPPIPRLTVSAPQLAARIEQRPEVRRAQADAAGAGTLLEVTGALTSLVQAGVTMARAEFDELAAVVSLRYALGRPVVEGAI
jgi:outer membrane protein TolC